MLKTLTKLLILLYNILNKATKTVIFNPNYLNSIHQIPEQITKYWETRYVIFLTLFNRIKLDIIASRGITGFRENTTMLSRFVNALEIVWLNWAIWLTCPVLVPVLNQILTRWKSTLLCSWLAIWEQIREYISAHIGCRRLKLAENTENVSDNELEATEKLLSTF